MVAGAENQGSGGRGDFLRPYKDYAQLYQKSERTLKRLVADGRAKGDLPPLDSPVDLVAWWERNMVHRVPAAILAAAGGDAMMEIPRAREIPPVAPEPVSEEAPPPITPQIVSGELGLHAALASIENLEAALRSEAANAGKTKGYLDTVNRLTILSKNLREEEERLGKLIPRDMVETILHEFHGPIEREIRLLYRSMCETTGLPPSPEREEAWNREVDRIFARLGGTILSAA